MLCINILNMINERFEGWTLNQKIGATTFILSIELKRFFLILNIIFFIEKNEKILSAFKRLLMQRTIGTSETGISFLMSNPGITDPVFQFIWLIIRESRFSPFWSIVKIERRLWILIVSGSGDQWRRRRPATPSPPTSISRRRSWGSCAISFSTRTSPYRSDSGHSSPSATSRAKAPAVLSLSVIFYLFSFCFFIVFWSSIDW